MKLLKLTFIISFIFFALNGNAQETIPSLEGKNALTVNGMRFAAMISVGYSYSIWQSKNQTFRTGLNTGIGYGVKELDNYSELVLPFGVYAEYGKKHRIGFDANIVYQYKTHQISGISPTGYTNYNVVFTNGAFTTSLYYSYNFGENLRYSTGLGGNLISFFGNNYGIEIQTPDAYAPFIFFGVRF